LIDSKLCQIEQLKDESKRKAEFQDFDNAFHLVLLKDFQTKTEHENMLKMKRHHDGIAVQEFQKQQMYEKYKNQRETNWDEINKEKEQISIEKREETEKEINRIKHEIKMRENLKNNIVKQIDNDHKRRCEEIVKIKKLEEKLNENARNHLMKEETMRKKEQEHFRMEVSQYLNQLRESQQLSDQHEKEKEKLIRDICQMKLQDDWRQHFEEDQKRKLKNKIAREGQVHQINTQNEMKMKSAAMEVQNNFEFNQREMNERKKIREEKWQERLKAYRYGEELKEQKKSEILRDALVKQKLDESMMLAEKDQENFEKMGEEFVKSFQDVLPMHPNFVMIKRGKKY
jgi:hypothetical protein